ncbi:MAG: MBOAT family protein [Parvibaculaceae bacterium]|nr:MBOAT family protein [Parvibaculaceae bacterium]
MLFNDPVFLFAFLPVSLIASYAARALFGREGALATLVLASIIFYGWWNPVYLPLLGGLAVFNFVLARFIVKERGKAAEGLATALTIFGVTVDLGALAWFKYTDFFIGTMNAAIGTSWTLLHIVLPLGISFFTFQKIAYLVDARRGEVEPHSFLEYCFFVMFFPQLIAGPIVHHKEIFSQTHEKNAFRFDLSNISVGLTIFLIGLFKKVVIADNLAPIVSHAFGAAAGPEPMGFLLAWQGMAAYTLQLYFDFSGYSDMAIGASRMFGIRLPLNFDSPYQSASIIEFWRRWHMTLSRFLRDYLYIGLGGNRHGRVRRYFNLMATMTLGGLWHGAAWTFVIWGFLHGLALIVNHAWRAVFPRRIGAWWSLAMARLITLLFVALAWVPFRAPGLEAAGHLLKGLVTLPGAGEWRQMPFALLALIVAVAGLWLVPNTQQWLANYRPAYNYGPQEHEKDKPLLIKNLWSPGTRQAVLVGLFAALSFLSLQRVSEFLYFQF